MGMAVYDAPFGPVVGVFDSYTNDVFVILDAGNVDCLEDGSTRSHEPEFVDMTPEAEENIRQA